MCYPKQREILSDLDPPKTGQGEAMVLIDKTNFELVWKASGDVSLNGKTWSFSV